MPAEFIPVAIAVTILLTLLLAAVGVVLLVRDNSRKRAWLQKARHSPSQSAFYPIDATAGEQAPSQGILDRLTALLGQLGRQVGKDKASDLSELRPMFLKAGIRSDRAPGVFWGAKVVLAVFLPLCFILFRILAPGIYVSPVMSVAIFTGLALAGFYAPNLWLTNRIQKRRQEILDSFPDVLDMMVVCVEAGMGLDSAINRVAKESYTNNPVLSEELHLFSLEIRAGKARKDALKNLAMRTDLQEMQNLVTLLIQTEKFGTSVSQALKVFSDTMRTERFQRAEAKAAQLPVKLLFPLVLFIFPSMFVVLIGPAVISIIEAFTGM